MPKPENPFQTVNYAGPEYFCDREIEADQLLSNIKSGNSTTLISIRRMGKTGLIQHVFSQLPENIKGIYIDILPTENLHDFFNVMITALARAFREKSSFRERMHEYISRFRPLMSFDPLTGMPQVSIELRSSEISSNVGSFFNLLEKQPFITVIAIDEFQQILKYPEKRVDSMLRTIIQSLTNVRFIFSGSQQHLMTDLFSNPSRPFYRSSQFLFLKSIVKEKYASFIQHHFKNGNISIDQQVIDDILLWTDLHTFYVQLLCSRIFASGATTITDEVWKAEADKILSEQEIVFFQYRALLSKGQWNLFRAIAKSGKEYEPTSAAFVKKHALGNASSVLRALHALLDREIVYHTFDSTGLKYYAVNDLLFRKWSENQ